MWSVNTKHHVPGQVRAADFLRDDVMPKANVTEIRTPGFTLHPAPCTVHVHPSPWTLDP